MTTYRSKLFGFPSNVFCHSHHLVNYRVHFLEKTRKKSSKTNSNWKEIELVLSHTPILPTLKTLFLTGKSDEKNNIINQVFSQLFFLSRFWPHAKKVDHPCYVCTYVFYHMWNIWDFLFHWAWSITQIKHSQNRDKVVLLKTVLLNFCPKQVNEWIGGPRASLFQLFIAFLTWPNLTGLKRPLSPFFHHLTPPGWPLIWQFFLNFEKWTWKGEGGVE